jgi:hypothetical protein
MRTSSALGVAACCFLVALAPAAAAKPAKGKAKAGQDRTGQVVYQDSAPADLTRTKILKVTVVQELPDVLVLDVEYNRADEFGDDELSLVVTPDISLWEVEQVFLLRGRNVVSQEISLQKEAKEPIESHNLSIDVQHNKDNHSLGMIFHRIVPFAKTWRPQRPS